jgi:pimeloyl-ACP methyl ester carboxylesterase
LVSTCGEKVDIPIPFPFKLMSLLVRLPGFASLIEKMAAANLEQAASRSIPDPDLRARTLQDPDTGPLVKELLASTSDRMAQRMPGSMNDMAAMRKTDYPLEEIDVPVLIVHGMADTTMPFERHAKALESRIRGAELLAIEGGEHVSIFTHRSIVKARVREFLRENSRVS